jgi:uncharacterized membrane protein
VRRPLIVPGVLMGAGLGGFLDGIVFHQILQTHSMLSAIVPPVTMANMKFNMLWDGLFHSLTWLMTVAGLVLLWRAGGRRDVPWSGRIFTGALLMGWGLFNLIEGLIDHHLLHIHHVIERLHVSVYDYAFLASGVILILIGLTLTRRAQR